MKDLNRPFFKKVYKWSINTNKCSISLVIKEIPIKTTKRYYFIPTEVSTIKKTDNNKCQWGYREIGTLIHCWWVYKMVQPLWKTVQQFLKKLNIELPDDPAIALLGIYIRDLETYVHTKSCVWIFTAVIFIITKTWWQPKCPSKGKWINKLCEVNVITPALWKPAQTVVLLYNRTLLSNKEKWLIDTGNNLDESQVEWRKPNLKILNTVWFCLYNILEMSKLQWWRTDQ